jgi:DNA-directed RNA polymerase specialized sigma24 family protein
MKFHPEITQADFDAVLAWLDEDREAAGCKYEEIRQGLVVMFAGRGCPDAKELADETINRVALKASVLVKMYEGNPAHYFYGVANNVHKEWLRDNKVRIAIPPPDPRPDIELVYDCLERCLNETLAAPERKLTLDYYRVDKQTKSEQRRVLAGRLGIAPNALRIRLHRNRANLQPCILKCLDQA